MTQEEKELLLKDLCARLLYGVKIELHGEICTVFGIVNDYVQCTADVPTDQQSMITNVKPYLRPMSSMTNDEKRKLQSFYQGSFGGQWLDIEKGTIDIFECSSTITLYLNDSERVVDWLNKKMFDYRGLIPMGLAIEAPKDMYDSNSKVD